VASCLLSVVNVGHIKKRKFNGAFDVTVTEIFITTTVISSYLRFNESDMINE